MDRARRRGRIVRFVLCLVIALPFQLAVVTVGVNVFESLGGRLQASGAVFAGRVR